MNKICTDIDQSNKLLELGLKPDTADMFYTMIDQGFFLCIQQGVTQREDDIPAWSLVSLLDLMPNATLIMKDHEGTTDLSYCFCIAKHEEFKSHSCLDAAYSFVVWLLENGYIKGMNHD